MGGVATILVRARPWTRSFREDWIERAMRSCHPLQARSNVRCDRATRICYKRGRVDKSETEDAFGDRADGLRDSAGTAHAFVTRRGAVCDRDRRLCFENGELDRDLTERFFGRRGRD
jgi:Fels-1 Prophage Protein-like